jgi:N-acetylmuramate 1-kinase
MIPADNMIRQYAAHILNLAETAPVEITPLAKGGSDRSFRRIRYREKSSVIFMHYNPEREENRFYAPIAGFLREIDVAVPGIFHHDPDRCFILMEDLGNDDLWSFREASWPVRRAYYRKLLGMIHKLHAFPVSGLSRRSLPLMEGFGPALYRWERNYFREHFVSGVCRIVLNNGEAEALESELEALAGRLMQTGISLVHRDLQSQNVLIYRGEPFLIDFQGMRTGSFFYDLGSLFYDPYVSLTEDERMELLRHYYELEKRSVDRDAFLEMFRETSAQRLMQALGAYGFLGRQTGREAFLDHIPRGLDHLFLAARQCPHLPRLRNLIDRCREAL